MEKVLELSDPISTSQLQKRVPSKDETRTLRSEVPFPPPLRLWGKTNRFRCDRPHHSTRQPPPTPSREQTDTLTSAPSKTPDPLPITSTGTDMINVHLSVPESITQCAEQNTLPAHNVAGSHQPVRLPIPDSYMIAPTLVLSVSLKIHPSPTATND